VPQATAETLVVRSVEFVRVEVVVYDAGWPARFAGVRDELAAALAGVPVLSIEHVGSTSVPGLAAKPVIDVDVVVDSADINAAIEALADAGYKYIGDCGIPNRHAFEAPPHGPPRHVYVIVDGCLALRNHIGVREVLRNDAQLRVEYGALKLDLATKEFDSIDDHVAAKSQLLQRVLHQAGLEEADLAIVDAVNRPPNHLSTAADLGPPTATTRAKTEHKRTVTNRTTRDPSRTPRSNGIDARSGADDVGIDDVGLVCPGNRWVRWPIGLEEDALTRAAFDSIDGGLFVAAWHGDARVGRVGHHGDPVTDVADAVIEHDEEFGTVVDAQPGPRAAVLIDPHSHRQHLLAAHRSYEPLGGRLDEFCATPLESPAWSCHDRSCHDHSGDTAGHPDSAFHCGCNNRSSARGARRRSGGCCGRRGR
jgi:GrpB-like predicted nucleotidyltransferase (UPF0157 family)